MKKYTKEQFKELLLNYPDTELELFAFFALEEQKEILKSKKKLGK